MCTFLQVEDVVGWRYGEDGITQEFRVRWKGFSAEDDTWEPKQNLLGLLHSFPFCENKLSNETIILGGCESMIDRMFQREAERENALEQEEENEQGPSNSTKGTSPIRRPYAFQTDLGARPERR